MTEICEVVLTAPDPDWLKNFARRLVVDHLAASVHNFTPIHSTYRWEGTVHDRTEGRASVHTLRSLIPAIVERARTEHPYVIPAVSARPIIDGNPDYLAWIANSSTGPSTPAATD